jgi:hypothetical protein
VLPLEEWVEYIMWAMETNDEEQDGDDDEEEEDEDEEEEGQDEDEEGFEIVCAACREKSGMSART